MSGEVWQVRVGGEMFLQTVIQLLKDEKLSKIKTSHIIYYICISAPTGPSRICLVVFC